MMESKNAWMVNRILLGLLMLVPGLMKMFVFGPSGVTGMFAAMGFPIPMFFAWLVMLSEVIFGAAIIANWKVRYTAWPPMVILLVAVIVTLPWSKLGSTQWPTVLLHLVAISSYWLLAIRAKN